MLKLVYGCLAFSLVACVIMFASAAKHGEGFRGMTKTMNDAIANGATILDADAGGAVTQTGNGRVTGYTRNLKTRWSMKFDRFNTGPDNPYGAGAVDAFAWCTMGCPSAILDVSGQFTPHGSAGAGLASTLTSLGLSNRSILSIQGINAALVASQTAQPSSTQLRAVLHKKSYGLPVANPSATEVGGGGLGDFRAAVGSARGNIGMLTLMRMEANVWKIERPRIREAGLKNACISLGGFDVGMISTHVRRMNSRGSPSKPFGPALASGTCTVDARGITAMYTAAANPNSLEAARYSASGKQLWHHTLGAQRLLSKSGWRYVVSQTANGEVTAIDSASGRTVFSQHVNGIPFVAKDGSILTADRNGEPHWLLVGEPIKYQ